MDRLSAYPTQRPGDRPGRRTDGTGLSATHNRRRTPATTSRTGMGRLQSPDQETHPAHLVNTAVDCDWVADLTGAAVGLTAALRHVSVNHPRLRTFRESRRSGLHITHIMPVVARASLLDTSTVPYHAALHAGVRPVGARRQLSPPRRHGRRPRSSVRSSGGWCVIDDARG